MSDRRQVDRRANPQYQVQRLARGVIFWYHAPDGLLWSVFVPLDGRVTQPMAAALLGMNVMTVIRWVRAGRLPIEKHPGAPSLIPLTALLERLDDGAAH